MNKTFIGMQRCENVWQTATGGRNSCHKPLVIRQNQSMSVSK